MKLSARISRLWAGRRGFYQADYIQLDKSPTALEEQAGFEDPSKLFAKLQHNNYLQDIHLRRKFANFALRGARFWMVFLAITTVFQGTGGDFLPTIYGVTIHLPKFHLEQWAFVGLCGSTTGSIIGLATLVGRYLFSIPQGSWSSANGQPEPKIGPE